MTALVEPVTTGPRSAVADAATKSAAEILQALGGVVLLGAVLPGRPVAHALGFTPLPPAFSVLLAGLVVGYRAPIEVGRRFFCASAMRPTRAVRPGDPHRHLRRRAAYFSVSSPGNSGPTFRHRPATRSTP